MSPHQSTTIAPRRNQLDGLRFLAFAGIFLYHADLARHWFMSYSVFLFFVLSGFLITGILLDNGEGARAGAVLRAFYIRRCLRIFPAYYLLMAVLLAFSQLHYIPWNLTYTFNIKLFLLSVEGGLEPLMNHWKEWGIHLWTLSVEEQYYLFFPLCLLAVPSRGRPLVLLALLAGSVAARAFFSAHYPQGYSGVLLPVCGEYFIWGGFAAWLHRRIPLRKGIPVFLIAAAVLLLAALIAFGGKPEELAPQFKPDRFQTLYALGFALLVWGLWADKGSLFSRALSLPPIAYLGKISYGLYLVHLFMWGVREKLVGAVPALGAVPETLLVFMLTVFFASLSWHLFESPVHDLKRRFPYPRVTPHAA